MFTGLVEEVGRVAKVLTVRGNRVMAIEAAFAGELKPGDSVAVNGCCLTVTRSTARSLEAEAVGATLKETSLGELRTGSMVNLERALRAGDRLGGHFVQGHVDEVARVSRVDRHAGHWRMSFAASREGSGFLVDRGSVCVNGVSLTVAGLEPGGFSVNVIPRTLESTNLKELRAGDRVNVEYDLIVKAVAANLGRVKNL